MLTPPQVLYFAHELTAQRNQGTDQVAAGLFDSSADLNPHQIDAAVFALDHVTSGGVILADEIGLGKTIEVGTILLQLRAEGLKRHLVICSASLRKQWSHELRRYFLLPTRILDESAFETLTSPLDFDGVTIVSFQFAYKIAPLLAKTDWDRVVIDEAHRLRNLHKPGSRIGRTLKETLTRHKKILVTAAPLTNSLLDLYSLTQLVDEEIFPDQEVFRANYVMRRRPNLAELKQRLEPILQRTLRKDVSEYIRFTRRSSVTLTFVPDPEQRQLDTDLNEYFFGSQRRYSIPLPIRNALMTFLHKATASSQAALLGMLETFRERLRELLSGDERHEIDESEIQAEMADLERFIETAKNIRHDPKAEALLKGLETAFAKLEQTGANRKALVFTQSIRTQKYLKDLLSENGYAGKVVTFNGRIGSTKRGQRRLKAFQEEAEILIATDAAAEGFNFPFCSLVVNYDLPWNPMQLEWRIGRCHRYGQKHDVTVLNFLNVDNYADVRAYRLLKERFKLFDGVFGSSDDVLGRLRSGVDFEKRIREIMNRCRTPKEIDKAFAALQKQFEKPIRARLDKTRRLLFERFDEEVRSRFRLRMEFAVFRLNRMTRIFWELIKNYYADGYWFDDVTWSFGKVDNERYFHYLNTIPPEPIDVDNFPSPIERRRLFRNRSGAQPFLLHGIDGQMILDSAKKIEAKSSRLVFNLSESPFKASCLEPLKGHGGWLRVVLMKANDTRQSEELAVLMCDESGYNLSNRIGEEMLLLPAVEDETEYAPCPFFEVLDKDLERQRELWLSRLREKREEEIRIETDKLTHWSEDLKQALELEIRQIGKEISALRNTPRAGLTLAEKIKLRQRQSELERRRTEKRLSLFAEQDRIDAERDGKIRKLHDNQPVPAIEERPLIEIEWKIV